MVDSTGTIAAGSTKNCAVINNNNKVNFRIINTFNTRELILIPSIFVPNKISKDVMVIILILVSGGHPGNKSGAIYSAPIMATAAVETALLITAIQFTIKANTGV